ncbi:unnamed protein product [Brassicogethes aeneus]|uniref:Uncharacterized protein n=1 Tax=Brassicogethes aeneus TaxID=1431903 RepID=A0A9P0FFX3_BRAAE|nr:unnamed protein product [Brassicogethes aeneus]
MMGSESVAALFIFFVVSCNGFPAAEQYWDGKWFPHQPNQPDVNPTVEIKTDHKAHRGHLWDPNHGVVMGVSDPNCDDAKTNLTIDWLDNAENYTCLEDKHLFAPSYDIRPELSTDHIPLKYSAPHYCMNEAIPYNTIIPTFGPHRPLWAKYGEYKFVPRQRWIHNLEHGTIVMLYHPCANQEEVKLLKSIVKSCLYRHVITPYNLLSTTRPLALVTWGQRLEMSKVATEVAIDFIKEHALKGPEQTSRDGQYDYLLLEHAEVPAGSNINDTLLCPQGVLKM